MIQDLIRRYKAIQSERFLSHTHPCQYAFVGLGQHSLTNLYPVLHYLGVPLKYICVTSERKARMIEQKYPSVKATASLDDILNDESIKGVFVSATPSAHFSIASRILESGKSLFIEKPPCMSLTELDTLIRLRQSHGSPVAMAGLQKRHAPAVQILKKRLRKDKVISYDLHYLTGAYPEGNAVFDLFIHPVDLAINLFGKAEILSCQKVAADSYILMLRHQGAVGTLELSTAYTWTAAEESLKVSTSSGIYRLSQMDTLTFQPGSATILGIPSEKVRPADATVEYLFNRNNFNPTLVNNQVYSQGYFNEISAFVDAVEGRKCEEDTDLVSVRDTYVLLDAISGI